MGPHYFAGVVSRCVDEYWGSGNTLLHVLQ